MDETSFDKFFKEQENITKLLTFSPSLLDSLNQTNKMMRQMEDLSKMIKSLEFPINNIKLVMPFIEQIKRDSGLFDNIIKTEQNFSKILDNSQFSNFIKIPSNIANLNIVKMDINSITPTIFNDSRDELTSLAKHLEIKQDQLFNIEGYEVLFYLELFLRRIINEKIFLKLPKEIDQKIDSKILETWEKRQKEEQESKHIDKGNYNLIDYSDFTDLKKIFEKGNNKKLFSDLVNEQDFSCVISKLHELDPIRKKIAHSRYLTKKEFEMLSLYYKQIIKLFSKK